MIRAARKLTSVVGDAWRLSLPYFTSEEKWAARGLFAAIVALNLLVVDLNVVYTYWYQSRLRRFADARRRPHSGPRCSPTGWYKGFPYIVPGFVGERGAHDCRSGLRVLFESDAADPVAPLADETSLSEVARSPRLLPDRARSEERGHRVDNPDQRIADDIADFVAGTLTLGISVGLERRDAAEFRRRACGSSHHRCASVLSRSPGYLVWAALLYSIAGTYLTQLIGRRLIPLTFQQQRRNADFRFGLVRVREHTEQIALYSRRARGSGRADRRAFGRFTRTGGGS